MSILVVIEDPLRNRQYERALRDGVPLGAELVRLFPDGIDGPWRVYRNNVMEGNEVAALDLMREATNAATVYILVRGPGAAVAVFEFFKTLAIAILLQAVVYFLTPNPRKPLKTTQPEYADSPNNLISAQTNQLRPGARVPELLGRVRSYPDLLVVPSETSAKTTQTTRQLFRVGVGKYHLGPATAKLGDTPTGAINGTSWFPYDPGDVVDDFPLVRSAGEVNDISLITEGDTIISGGNTTFAATGKTATTTDRIPGLPAGVPITISATNFNNRQFATVSVPLDSQTTGP